MKATLRQWLAKPVRLLFDKLRRHITLAVAEDFRQLARHVTIEREQQACERQEETKRILAALEQMREQFEHTLDGCALASESMVRELVLLQRQIAEIAPPRLRLDDYRHDLLDQGDDAADVRRAA
ncbi:MAG TPA: hypothetical protein VHC22_07370 [Pirellulales bacterium]|nr:hypothetical protein [Pirellulales bacterium]